MKVLKAVATAAILAMAVPASAIVTPVQTIDFSTGFFDGQFFRVGDYAFTGQVVDGRLFAFGTISEITVFRDDHAPLLFLGIDAFPLFDPGQTTELIIGNDFNNDVILPLSAAATIKITYPIPLGQFRLRTAGMGPLGFSFDNLVLQTVPEPATWAMMIAGFGMAGVAMRRGRSRSALPA
jgi:hypothetical protein